MGTIKYRILTFVLFILSVTGVHAQAPKKIQPAQQNEIISTSDIHFNPFYDPSLMVSLAVTNYSRWDSIFAKSKDTLISPDNRDANYPLFKSALVQMRKTLSKPKYIIVTGDFLAHNFNSQLSMYLPDSGMQKQFINNTIGFTAWMFNKYFPNTVILPVLGNNDSYCGDYDLAPGSPFLAMFAKAWVPLQRNNDKAKDSAFIASFSTGGYYTFYPKSDPGHKLVMMNTIFFSSKYMNSCGNYNTTQPGADEMSWLENELATNDALGASANKIWLAYHIPPGIDPFRSTNPGYVSTMWQPTYNTTFLQLLTKYSSNITANFAGHTHMDDFRVLYDSTKKPVSFVHITPSISRSNGNYPGFQTVTYEQGTYALTNYKTTYLNAANIAKPVWGLEYDFNSQYALKGINPASLSTLYNSLHSYMGANKKLYIKYFDVSNPLHISSISNNWRCYWCSIGELTPEGFTKCMNQ